MGHTYLYIEKDEKSYLFDPAMSGQIIEDYRIGTGKIIIKSMLGDQLIYAIHDFPGKTSMLDFDFEHALRRKAFQYWKELKSV